MKSMNDISTDNEPAKMKRLLFIFAMFVFFVLLIMWSISLYDALITSLPFFIIFIVLLFINKRVVTIKYNGEALFLERFGKTAWIRLEDIKSFSCDPNDFWGVVKFKERTTFGTFVYFYPKNHHVFKRSKVIEQLKSDIDKATVNG